MLHSSDSYAIYWDPIGSYRGDWKRLIDGYFQNVGSASGSPSDIFALDGQYTEVKSGAVVGRAANQSTFRGAYTDKDEYPSPKGCSEGTVCLSDAQIQRELEKVIASGALPGATGPPVYYVLTPPGVTVCTDGGSASTCSASTKLESEPKTGICGYHSVINPNSADPIVYAVQPWVAGEAGRIVSENPLVTKESTAAVRACQDNTNFLNEPNQLIGLNPFGEYVEGLADVIVNDLSIEQSNIVVDPLFTGWYQNGSNAEQGDMFKWSFGPPPPSPPPLAPLEGTNAVNFPNETINGHTYYLQWAFDSVGVTSGKGVTAWSGVILEPHFTSPNPVNAGDVVGFDATESNITLDANPRGLPADEPFTAPVYKWDFGDGTVVSGENDASEFHSYQYGGSYNVTLTVTDSAGNVASYANSTTVVGPPRPGTGGGSGTSPQTGSVSSGSSSPGPGSTAKTLPRPVATQTILSRSLSRALRSGLVIRYSVNEQVAGHFEVLLASSVAKRIGLHGAPATGLAKGTPRQIVIAKAILVTTKGGRNAVKIRFGKQTAAKLHRLRKVTLMLRLIVRNASSHSPLSTTVLSTVTLSR